MNGSFVSKKRVVLIPGDQDVKASDGIGSIANKVAPTRVSPVETSESRREHVAQPYQLGQEERTHLKLHPAHRC